MSATDVSLFAALLMGVLGTTHCIGMCGGISASIGLTQNNSNRGLWLIFSYNLGRIFSYTLAGGLAGFFGELLLASPLAIYLRLFAALLLIAMGLYVAQWWQGVRYIEKAGTLIWRFIRPLAARFLPADTLPRALMLGVLWGWLPCGLVYSTLLWTLHTGSAAESALTMLAFGAGTLPSMMIAGVMGQQLKAWLQKRTIRSFAGLLIILFGIYSIPFHALTL